MMGSELTVRCNSSILSIMSTPHRPRKGAPVMTDAQAWARLSQSTAYIKKVKRAVTAIRDCLYVRIQSPGIDPKPTAREVREMAHFFVKEQSDERRRRDPAPVAA